MVRVHVGRIWTEVKRNIGSKNNHFLLNNCVKLSRLKKIMLKIHKIYE